MDGIEDVESLVEEATRLESEVITYQNLLNDQRLTKMSAKLVDVAHELSLLFGFTGFGVLGMRICGECLPILILCFPVCW